MQPSEKYKVKEKFDVSTFRFDFFSLYFSGTVVASLPTKVLLLLALPKNGTDSSYYRLHQIVINYRWRRRTPFSNEEVFILNWFSYSTSQSF